MSVNNLVNVKIDVLNESCIKLTILIIENNIFNLVFKNNDLTDLISIYNYSLEEIIKEEKYDVLEYRLNDYEFRKEIGSSNKVNELFKDINENKDLKLLLLKIKFNHFNCIVPEQWLKYVGNKFCIKQDDIGPFGSPNGWDYLSWSDIIDNIANSTECWYDVACHYAGMGHFYVMSLIKDNEKCFFRITGGANGYDRLSNMQMFQNHNPYLQKNKLFNLKDGIELLENINYDLYQILQEGDSSKIKLN